MSNDGTEPVMINSAENTNELENRSLKRKLKSLQKNVWLKKIKRLLIEPLLFLLTFSFIWGVCGSCILPPSNYFSLFILYVLSVYLGKLSELVYLPDLFGMIVAGLICRNIPQLQINKTLDPAWSSFLRSTALVVILIRAGMGLDPKALRKLSCGVLRLALSPCLIEIVTAALMSKLLLNLPWVYGFILGSVLAAVSPAVVVPCLLNLSVQGYGVDKGIPTLVIAASSIDDVFAITLFGIFIGFTFDTGNMLFMALKTPLELLLGVAYGGVVAVILWCIPPQHHARSVEIRASVLLLAGFAGLFGSARLDFGGMGPIGAIVLGFVAMIRWNKQAQEADTAQSANDRLCSVLEMIWTLLKPFLFVLIGAEVDLARMDARLVGLGLVVLLVGLCARMLVTFVAVCGNNLLLREKLFVTISWLPKATVQAAIGGLALDRARRLGLSEDEQTPAMTVVTIAVLSIVVTAPLGAIFITKLGPRLLEKATSPRKSATTSELRSSNIVVADGPEMTEYVTPL